MSTVQTFTIHDYITERDIEIEIEAWVDGDQIRMEIIG